MSDQSSPLLLGHARRDITPPLGVRMGGYSARKGRGCEEIEMPLSVDALFLEQSETRVVLITADLVDVDEGWTSRIRATLSTQLSMPATHVVVLASHTHFGPSTRCWEAMEPMQAAWLNRMENACIEAAMQASGHLQEVTLRVGQSQVTPIMFNRRLRRPDGTCCTVYTLPLPEEDLQFGPVDDKLTVLRFDGPHGQPVAILTSVGMHPVTGGGNFYGISPDYPGYLKQNMEAIYRVPCMFALGTAGNVVPIARGADQRERIGRFLAGAAMKAAETAMQSPVSLCVTHERFPMPTATLVDGAAAEERLAIAQTYVEQCQEKGDARLVEKAKLALRREEHLAKTARYRGPGSSVPFEITAIHLGHVGLVALPGEIFAETGLALQQRSIFPYTLVLSMANQSTEYLPTRTAFWAGGYELTDTTMCEESEGSAVEVATRLLLQCWQKGLE